VRWVKQGEREKENGRTCLMMLNRSRRYRDFDSAPGANVGAAFALRDVRVS
jgi:hypothetical protein